MIGLGDQRDTPRRLIGRVIVAERHRSHPFGAGSRFASTSAAQHQPASPALARKRWRQLIIAPPQLPVSERGLEMFVRPIGHDIVDERVSLAGVRAVA